METIVSWFAATLGKYISAKALIFIVSMIPILECRGGLVMASLLQVDIRQAIPICIIGNIIPIPFILLFIQKIFHWLKRFSWSRKIVENLEQRAMNKSDKVQEKEFLGLLLFVGIPLPGTGAWTGSLIASLLEMDLKKASLAILIGIFLATVIVSSVSYGLLSMI
ncbi:MAG: small multi-drug export protein [Erysipelotrichaceae bacterium]|nr:small multi-drug export protein [Erysipelotrichaceae bacterium]